jgi:hypothetical protein
VGTVEIPTVPRVPFLVGTDQKRRRMPPCRRSGREGSTASAAELKIPSAPTATASRTACRRRPRPAALPRPPCRPALLEPPPSPVCRHPGHSYSLAPTTTPTPIAKFVPRLRRAPPPPRHAPPSAWSLLAAASSGSVAVAGLSFQMSVIGFSRWSREEDHSCVRVKRYGKWGRESGGNRSDR